MKATTNKKGRPARSSKTEAKRRAKYLRGMLTCGRYNNKELATFLGVSVRTLGYWLNATYCAPDTAIQRIHDHDRAQQRNKNK